MKDLASIWRSLSVKWGDRTGRLGVCVHVCRSMCACVYFMVIIGAFPTIPGFSRRFPGFPAISRLVPGQALPNPPLTVNVRKTDVELFKDDFSTCLTLCALLQFLSP